MALNSPLQGDLQGVRGADLRCSQEAREEGLGSSYRAFVSSQLQDVRTVVRRGEQHLPVLNLQVASGRKQQDPDRESEGSSDFTSSPFSCLRCPQGEVLVSSWAAIFSGDGGVFNLDTPLYSFDGRNVMTDPGW